MGLEERAGWVGVALRTIRDSMAAINSLAGRGTEVVETRAEGYREFDPEVIRADKVAEELILERLRAAGAKATVLSEEVGRLELPGGPGELSGEEKAYVIVDPFDGSMLYRRQIPAFWYSCLGVYGADLRPCTAAIGDVIHRSVDFCDADGAYTGQFRGGELADVQRAAVSHTTELKDAFVETYLMKPGFMYPTAAKFEPLLSKCKFILPNGGPAGFADVAKGRIDIYLAVQEAGVEVFTGLPLALKAGAVVTTFDGQKPVFEADINKTFAIVCSANEKLHEQVLAEIARIM